MSRRRILTLLAAAAVLRLLFPTADPPPSISWSGGYYSDEGFWIHNARNKILFGEYVLDDWNNMYMSPVVHVMNYAVFKICGVGVLQVRCFAIACSIMALIVLVWCARKLLAPSAASYVLLFFGFNIVSIVYNRLALLETPLTLFIVLAYYWALSPNRSWRNHLIGGCLGGIFAAVAFITKFTSGFILAVLLIDPIDRLIRNRDRTAWYSLASISGGFLITLAPYIYYVYLPHHDWITRYNSYYQSQQSWAPGDLLRNIVQQPFFLYFFRSPVLLLLSMAGLLGAFITIRKKQTPSMIELTAIGWFLMYFLEMAVFGYRPLRYYLPILPAMTILAAIYLDRMPSLLGEIRTDRWVCGCAVLLAIITGVQAGLLVLAPYLPIAIPGLTGNPAMPRLGALVYLGLIGITVVATFARKSARSLPVIYLVVFLLMSLGEYAHWVITRRYDVEAAREYLRNNLTTSVIAGQWAPQLCLGTDHRAIPLWRDFVNDNKPFDRFGIQYVLSWNYQFGDEYAHQREWFPEEMALTEKVTIFTIKNTPVILSRIKTEELGQPPR